MQSGCKIVNETASALPKPCGMSHNDGSILWKDR